MADAVESPILGSPYYQPDRHWRFGPQGAVLAAGRRPSGDLLVEEMRRRVGAWREAGYPGATQVTRRLLRRWAAGDRLFFAQREAVETVAYLHECAEADPRLRDGATLRDGSTPRDSATPQDRASPQDGAWPRVGCRLATGAGKTAVMGALIAWQLLNRLAYPRDPRFTAAVLVLCPNLMVRHRLGELSPHRGEGSVYCARDLVTPAEMVALRRGRVRICTWHALARRQLADVGGTSARVVDRGAESDEVLVRRVMGGAARGRLLVLNDEAHHAHRSGADGPTVWAEGLDALHTARGIAACVDLTATPVDPVSGVPLPWVVSSFPLADAIESGMVKLPQVPHGMPVLPWSRGAAAICDAARPALDAMAGRYRETAARWKAEARGGLRSDIPPVFAVVCRDIALAKAVHAYLAAEHPEFGQAVRLDSRASDDAQPGSGTKAAQHMRWLGTTIGLAEWPGGGPPAEYAALAADLGIEPSVPPGRDVRCVVSVAMLAEGWDARNVTHLVGLRPFGSALLVEQVVGRGLRRSRPGAFGSEEVVEVAGVPFEDIPLRADPDRPPRPVAIPSSAPTEPARPRPPAPAAPLAFDPALLEAALGEATGATAQQRAFEAALAVTRTLEHQGPPHMVFPAALAALGGV